VAGNGGEHGVDVMMWHRGYGLASWNGFSQGTDRVLGGLMRNERVEKEQDSRSDQRAADQKESYEGERMRPE
jgi:hypothetical protein